MKKIFTLMLIFGLVEVAQAADITNTTSQNTDTSQTDASVSCSKTLSEQSCNQAYVGAICHRGSVEGQCQATNPKGIPPICACRVKSEMIPLSKTRSSATPANNSSLRCKDSNVYGDYAQGGGCNQYGCYPPGGSCNEFGCSMKGPCKASGCPQKVETYYCKKFEEE